MSRPFFSTAQLADRWQMKQITLRHWRLYGKGPQFHKMGGSIRYYVDEIEKYEKEQIRSHTTMLHNAFLNSK